MNRRIKLQSLATGREKVGVWGGKGVWGNRNEENKGIGDRNILSRVAEFAVWGCWKDGPTTKELDCHKERSRLHFMGDVRLEQGGPRDRLKVGFGDPEVFLSPSSPAVS